MPVFAAYVCKTCDVSGSDPEVSPGLVYCWNCGEPAVTTARLAGGFWGNWRRFARRDTD
jgi:hypothetical protein